jgi:hypothetical protein
LLADVSGPYECPPNAGLAVKSAQLAWEITMLLLGGTGLFAGLSRLSTSPLTAVLIIVSAMIFLMFPSATMCGAELRLPNGRKKRDCN